MRSCVYVGVEAYLRGKTALVFDNEMECRGTIIGASVPNSVLAQFDERDLTSPDGTRLDCDWHVFSASAFDDRSDAGSR